MRESSNVCLKCLMSMTVVIFYVQLSIVYKRGQMRSWLYVVYSHSQV